MVKVSPNFALNEYGENENNKDVYVDELLREILELLVHNYEVSGDEVNLIAAKKVMLVMEAVTVSGYIVKYIRPDVDSVRKVLGRWPKIKAGDLSADFVAKDVVTRVLEHRKESLYYQRGQNKFAFQLIVLLEVAYLIDLERKYIFRFY